MANPSTIWAQLALPNPPVGSIPYVLSDGATIGTDVLNFNYASSGINNLFVSEGLHVNADFSQALAANPIINRIAGVASIPAGSSSVTVSNSKLLSTNALVFIVPIQNDATLTRFWVTNGVGTFTVTGNANATARWQFNFIIFNATSVHP